MRTIGKAELSSAMLAFLQLTTPPHSSCILIGQMQHKPSESCQKDVKKLSKTNLKVLLGVVTVKRS